ncbi:hypothetical protein VB713_16420 [Anabaena cylindrica UHCC 0172]|uniref:hypothetical protein n=1 Tax=Anabaena cylindrica TaxID=1165 RepID=UPI002B21CB0B|nr:hypothetical protein [Anabaena cylindrica]MEA5552527.1 hypothetical protein [Anabaena cylindrica UHCC 0172]
MPKDNSQATPASIRLFEQNGETSRFIDAELNEKGDLLIFGQDIGKAPLETWGDTDYEFWVTVAKKDKDKVLLALLKKLYSNNPSAVDEFRNFCKSAEIPFKFETWT